jgi:hypothetical protein
MPNFSKYRALVAMRSAADGTAMLTKPIANCSTVVTPDRYRFRGDRTEGDSVASVGGRREEETEQDEAPAGVDQRLPDRVEPDLGETPR